MDDSILLVIKELLGLDKDYDSFDKAIITHINSVFSILRQLGVGPETGFKISGNTETWSNFITDMSLFEDVKTYIYLKVRLIFDPPTSSVQTSCIEKEISELEWRLNVESS